MIFVEILTLFYYICMFMASLYFLLEYDEFKINPFNYFRNIMLPEIETLGQLIITILVLPGWLGSIVWYCIYKLFINKYTKKIMNIRIR